MARFLLLFSSVMSLFVLSWGTTRLFRPKNCINSTLVRKVVIEPAGGEVPNCSIEVRLFEASTDPKVASWGLIERIENLERVVPFIDVSDTAKILKIDTDKTQILSFRDQEIVIGRDLLEQKGLLERAILTQSISRSQQLSTAVIVDFMWSELLAKAPKPAARAWVNYVSNLKGYCQSEQALLLHTDFCRAHNEFQDSYIIDVDSEAVPWAMAPLYTQVLRKFYATLNIFEKKTFLENIMFLGEVDDSLLVDIHKQKNPRELETRFFSTIKDWLMPTTLNLDGLKEILNEYSIFNSSHANYIYVARSSRLVFPYQGFENQTDQDHQDNQDQRDQRDQRDQLRGDDSGSIQVREEHDGADVVVGNEGKGAEKGLKLSEKFAGSNLEPNLIQWGREILFAPNGFGFRLDKDQLFKEGLIQNFIYVSCDLPNPAELLQFSNYTKRIVFLKQCEADDIDWSEFYTSGLDNYLLDHTELQFVEFNLTALKIAQKLRGPLRDSDNFASWKKWLLFQRTIDDKDFQIQKALSAIEGVGRFRIF